MKDNFVSDICQSVC